MAQFVKQNRKKDPDNPTNYFGELVYAHDQDANQGKGPVHRNWNPENREAQHRLATGLW